MSTTLARVLRQRQRVAIQIAIKTECPFGEMVLNDIQYISVQSEQFGNDSLI